MVKSKREEKGNREGLLRDSSRKKLARSPGPSGEMQKQTPEAPVLKEMLLVDSVITSFPGIFFLFDEQGHLLHWNRNTETVSGYAAEEITGMSPLDLFEREEKELITKRIGEAFLQGESEAEAHLITKDGKKIPYYFTARRFVSRDRKYLVGMGIDISERKKAEEVLRNEQQWQLTFFNAVQSPIFLLDPDGRIIRHNQATASLAGKPGSDLRGRYCCEVVHGSSAPIENCPFICMKESKHKEDLVFETDGRWLQVIVHPVLNDDGNLIGAVHSIEDITERRRIQQENDRRARQLTELQKTSIELTAELNLDALLQSIAQHALDLIGGKSCNCYIHKPELDRIERVATTGEELVLGEKMRRRGEGAVGQVWATGAPLLINDYRAWPGRRKEYDHFPSRALVSVPVRWGDEFLGVLVILAYMPHRYTEADADMLTMFATQAAIAIRNARIHDQVKQELAERKRMEEALRESEEYLRNLITYASVPIVVWKPDFSITEFNQAFERLSGLSRKEVLGEPLEILFPAENRDASLEHIKKTAGGERWEAVYIPIAAKDGTVRLVLWNSANIPDRWGRLAVTIAQGIDVTEHRQAEQRVAETLNRLRRALGGIIQVVSATVETRDPYTAGHQKRVANLAQAIAREMGLSADRVDGLRMAGIIHDLGKVSIPAEILSKPTKLTEIEFKIIQAHPQTGHDILEGIDFPWPVAEIVLQHHERMNGSGYPRGLKGEEILIEARILAVADVVEAIASHRPYRPGHGIETALLEIEKNRGILYDPAAADACLKLIQEKGFRLDQDASSADEAFSQRLPTALPSGSARSASLQSGNQLQALQRHRVVGRF